MKYTYRCTACDASASAPTRDTIRAVRDEHRRLSHGGLTPRGERLTAPPPPPKAGLLRRLWDGVPTLDRFLIATVLALGLLLTSFRL